MRVVAGGERREMKDGRREARGTPPSCRRRRKAALQPGATLSGKPVYRIRAGSMGVIAGHPAGMPGFAPGLICYGGGLPGL